jgi:DNA-binding beta-propeller fold protein YncE
MKSKKKLILLCAAGTIVLGAVLFAVLWSLRTPYEPPPLLGGTEAVMTTRVHILSGVTGSDESIEEFYYPLGVVLDRGAILVADSMNDRIQIIGQDRTVRVGEPGSSEISFAESGFLRDGPVEDARFKKPSDIALLNGNILVCDTGNNAIRIIKDNIVLTVAGGLGEGYQDGKEGEALFNRPRSIAVSPDGTIYVADTMNHCIRAIDAEGNVTLFAGTPGESGYAGGGLLEAMFYEPGGLFFGADGVLYVSDTANHAIRKIDGGRVTTIAGRPGGTDPATGYPSGGLRDGANADARFNFPAGLTVLPNGDIYVADTMNHSIRLISGGTTRTVLGNGESGRYYTAAENMRLAKPFGVASDGSSLYITDAINNAVLIVPITGALKAGRPLRDDLLAATGVSADATYNGEPRVFAEGERVRFDSVDPWNTADAIYIPIRPLFEAMGAWYGMDDQSMEVTIGIGEQYTKLGLNQSYFMVRGAAVMPLDEITRLFPYVIEWFPEYSIITASKGGYDG